MQFNLKDYLNNAFGITNEVSVPLIVSVIVFITGGVAMVIRAQISNYVGRRRTRRSFKNIMIEIARTSKVKSQRLIVFYPTLKIDHVSGWNLEYNAVSYIGIAFNQDYSTVFNAFIRQFPFSPKSNLRIKCFNKLWSILENFKFIEERMLLDLEQMNFKMNEHQNRYKDWLEQLRRENDLMMSQNKTLPRGEEIRLQYLQARDRIFHEWQQLPDWTELHITHDQLIVPLRALNQQYQQHALCDQHTIPLNNILLPATYEYHEMVYILNVYNAAFRNYFYNYHSGYRVILHCLSKL